MSKLECKDFTVKYFGYDAAISGVTTTFSDGINVIYAAEKGGKTTFLKAISGIVAHTGELLLDGEEISNTPLRERDFQMLFDDYALFSRHSARYNLEFPLNLRKVPKTERRKRAEEAAALFDLDVMIDAPVYRLNEWHKVSLVLCRAYLRNAKVLLIDNILSKLDPQSRKEAFRRYLPLFASRGIVLYATDSVEESAALSEEIKLLSYGYLLQEGSAETFRTRPACIAAFAAFEEYPSLLPCRAEKGAIVLFGEKFETALSLRSNGYEGKEVIAGFAPTDFEVASKGFTATVKGAFLKGMDRIYQMECEGAEFYLSDKCAHAVGENLTVAVKTVTALFDEVNERTIVREKDEEVR